MKGYFPFDCKLRHKNAGHLHCRLLYKAPGHLSVKDLADIIEKSIQTALFPDVLAIICNPEEKRSVVEAFSTSPDLQQAAKRATNKITLIVCTYSRSGQLNSPRVIRNQRPFVTDLLIQNSQQIINCGVTELFSTHGVLVEAPSGFIFVKPSGEKSTFFLRCEEALFESERAEFLAFVLLGFIAKREQETAAPIEIIYIDSMTIASVAYALREQYCKLYKHPSPRVISFHSYDGFATLDTPLPRTSFCLISASSSMNLGRRWLEQTKCFSSEVLTLLTFKSAKEQEKALHAMEPPVDIFAPSNNSAEILRDLRIFGERFSPEEIPPKKIVLKAKEHGLDAVRKIPKIFSDHQAFRIFSRNSEEPSVTKALFLDGKKLLDIGHFKNFLDKILYQKTPVSLQAIVHQSDKASQILANECSKRLQTRLKLKFDIPVISQDEIFANKSLLDSSRALLIVAAVVGRGTKLLSCSRDLRDLHKGARTYVIGTQICHSKRQIEALARNLQFSSSEATILVEAFYRLAIGFGIENSFRNEPGTFQDLFSQTRLRTSELANRILTCRDELGVGPNTFLPSGSSLKERLYLREDFAFWDAGYSPNLDYGPAVLATVGAILQNAREFRFTNSENRLATDVFQQVILDPENFSRFNDGIVQAAILRAAQPSELDYSFDSVASEHMLEILIKVFEQCEKAQGEAALEFAYAICTKKLRLKSDCLKKLKDRCAQILTGNDDLVFFLRILLSIDKPRKPIRSSRF